MLSSISKYLVRSSLIEFACIGVAPLDWSRRGMTSQGGATLMRAKWITLYLILVCLSNRDVRTGKVMKTDPLYLYCFFGFYGNHFVELIHFSFQTYWYFIEQKYWPFNIFSIHRYHTSVKTHPQDPNPSTIISRFQITIKSTSAIQLIYGWHMIKAIVYSSVESLMEYRRYVLEKKGLIQALWQSIAPTRVLFEDRNNIQPIFNKNIFVFGKVNWFCFSNNKFVLNYPPTRVQLSFCV